MHGCDLIFETLDLGKEFVIILFWLFALRSDMRNSIWGLRFGIESCSALLAFEPGNVFVMEFSKADVDEVPYGLEGSERLILFDVSLQFVGKDPDEHAPGMAVRKVTADLHTNQLPFAKVPGQLLHVVALMVGVDICNSANLCVDRADRVAKAIFSPYFEAIPHDVHTDRFICGRICVQRCAGTHPHTHTTIGLETGHRGGCR